MYLADENPAHYGLILYGKKKQGPLTSKKRTMIKQICTFNIPLKSKNQYLLIQNKKLKKHKIKLLFRKIK